MKTIQVSEATNTQLDWLVAKCEGAQGIRFDGRWWCVHFGGAEEYLGNLDYTTDWSQMGPIIEREKISLSYRGVPQEPYWAAETDAPLCQEYGATFLTAAARCYVMSKLGETVDVPEELC